MDPCQPGNPGQDSSVGETLFGSGPGESGSRPSERTFVCAKSRKTEVFFRDKFRIRLRRPRNVERGIVPKKSTLGGRGVGGGAFVKENRCLAGNAEAVGKPGRNIEGARRVRRERLPVPTPEGGRVLAQIHRHIEDSAFEHKNEFSLGVRRFLKMKTAHGAPARSTDVVLDKSKRESHATKFDFGKAFKEVAARIAEDAGFD